MGVIFALGGLAFRYTGMAGVWRWAPRDTPPATTRLKGAFTATLNNKQFVYFIPTFIFFNLAVGMVIGWLPFFVKGVLGKENGGAFTSLLTGAALVGMVLSVLVLWRLSNTKGKRWVYSACLLGTAIYLPFLSLAGFIPGIPKLPQGIAMAFLAGVPMAGVFLLPRAITADITDYDELLTGMRREGVFYATQNLFEKIAGSFTSLLLALVLTLGETSSNPLGLRMVGPVAGALAFLGFWLFRGYRLPDTITAETVTAAGLEIPNAPIIAGTHQDAV